MAVLPVVREVVMVAVPLTAVAVPSCVPAVVYTATSVPSARPARAKRLARFVLFVVKIEFARICFFFEHESH